MEENVNIVYDLLSIAFYQDLSNLIFKPILRHYEANKTIAQQIDQQSSENYPSIAQSITVL